MAETARIKSRSGLCIRGMAVGFYHRSPPCEHIHMSKTTASLLLAIAALPALAQNPHTMFPPVRGTRQMVGAANNLEVEAGYRILEQGGNAVDAGVASVLAAAVTEQDHFGLGGE